jgi:hypothetical protein
VPDKWKDDFAKITSGKFSELSDEYIEIIVQFYPELKDKILKICRGEMAE